MIKKFVPGIVVLLVCYLSFQSCSSKKNKPNKDEDPNIILIYADDLGYGDLGAYNNQSKIPTPNMDRLAIEGILFTDAHSPAGICAPSRYSLLTGRYAWREESGTLLGHAYSQCKIETGRPTIASVLKDHGYNTAQIGKWGVRSDYRQALKDPNLPIDSITPESFDFTKPIYGTNTRGFDYSLTLLMLAGRRDSQYFKNEKWFFENGFPYKKEKPVPANFDWYACFPTIKNRVLEYIDTYAGISSDTSFRIDRNKPFFMYFDPHLPHEPIVPNDEFIHRSKAGKYGDFVVELDDAIGEIIKALEKNGLRENTLIILSSDNGPERTAYERILEYDHFSMGQLRGVKRDIWEGGHRVPFIASWPAKIPFQSICNESIGIIDLFSTFCDMVNTPVPANAAGDSYTILPALLGEDHPSPIREPLIYHSFDGRFAISDENWVLVDASTGMVSSEPEWFKTKRGVKPNELEIELFNLEEDPQQLNNVANEYPDRVRELKKKMDLIMDLIE